jgi:acyl-[acyl-carrier-protein]-phospholipid O-acyltransferase/long-chain-fatty-acid--[acyl-carrier-protein] ligase
MSKMVDAVLKGLLAAVLRLLYRIEIKGAEHLAAAGRRAVIVVNHVSYLDPVLMVAFLPGAPVYPINTYTAGRWWVRPFLGFARTFKVDPLNPMSTKSLIQLVQRDNTCVIFPEGRLTRTGGLMKIYEGPGLIADRSDAMLVPVRIDGAQYTPFSHLKGKLRLRWFPRITITILPPSHFEIPAEIKGRERRRMAGTALYDVMSRMMFETTSHERTLYRALLDASHLNGSSLPILEDVERRPMTYKKLLLGSLVLGRHLAKTVPGGHPVGVMLPNVIANPVVFFALQLFGRTPAMLNFSTGPSNLLAACEVAGIRTVLTSRRFVQQARLEKLTEPLAKSVDIVYLEDVRTAIRASDKVKGLLSLPFIGRIHDRARKSPHDPAVILFTSGSEGVPKGVVLSHYNILSNCHQLAARIAFSTADSVFNALPVFHSFGQIALLLPMLNGIRTFLYPSPLHYRIVPELAYDTSATVMFGTDTFLAGYARVASPYDFYNVRYVVAGGEKVRDETRKAWIDKFGLRILEGYGSTETSPVMAINTPMHYRAGTVGRFLPGIEYRLEPVEGVAEGGRLFIHGPNVMAGYLKADKPGEIQPPEGGWYDTGDVVSVDKLGYVTISGRAKRFAKIAGEMISLAKVESELTTLWPEAHHAVIAVKDDRRGEQLFLVTDQQGLERGAISTGFREHGLSELMVPKTIRIETKVPMLGSGKIDYRAVETLAETANA